MNSRGWFNELGQFLDQAIRHFDSPTRPFRVFENEGGWTIELEAPGLSKDSVSLEIRDRELHLKLGEAETRKLPIGARIDATAISAKLADGILRVRLPKADTASDTRRVEIL